jgi:predicted oxidoreductase
MNEVATMSERAKLHIEGSEFSRLIWGSMRAFDQFTSARQLADFLLFLVDHGITTIDTADVYGRYGVENYLGAALKLMGSAKKKLQIITKTGICNTNELRPENRLKHYDLSTHHITVALDSSLLNLGVDTVDLLLVHRPDPLMNADETARALDQAVAAGKVKHVGVSNFRPSQFELLASRLKAPIVTNQIQFSPLYLDPLTDGTLDMAQRLRIRPQIWSPLAGGRLITANDERSARVRDALAAVARSLDLAGPAEAALAWVLRHPCLLYTLTLPTIA